MSTERKKAALGAVAFAAIAAFLPLAAAQDPISDVQEHRGLTGAWCQHLDHAALLDDEQPATVVPAVGGVDRARESADNHLELHRPGGRGPEQDRQHAHHEP